MNTVDIVKLNDRKTSMKEQECNKDLLIVSVMNVGKGPGMMSNISE